MFFKVNHQKKSSSVSGYIAVKNPLHPRQNKNLICLTIEFSGVSDLIAKSITDSKSLITKEDLNTLQFREIPNAKVLSPILDGSEDCPQGWFPSLSVLELFPNEHSQLIDFLNKELTEEIKNISENSDLQNDQINEDINILHKLKQSGFNINAEDTDNKSTLDMISKELNSK